MSDLYNVVFKGEILDGFKLVSVRENFAKVFKLEPAKVDSYFSGKALVLRKKVDHKTAYKFKAALAKFGASVELKRIAAGITPALDELSLVPLEQKSPEVLTESKVETQETENVTSSFNAETTNQPSGNFDSQTGELIVKEEEFTHQGDSFNTNALLVSIAAAVVGAFIWKFIAVAFDYELGLIAWGIGGAIGFTAAMFGSRGHTAGIICGVLALLSIFGGKYMAYSTFQAEFADTYSSQSGELREAYNQEKSIADIYISTVQNEQSQKQFMADYGYSYSTELRGVTDEEFYNFVSYAVPRFEALAYDSMDFDTWSNTSYEDVMTGYSTFDLMKESFGLLDVLFLFFGVGTAFRLANGG